MKKKNEMIKNNSNVIGICGLLIINLSTLKRYIFVSFLITLTNYGAESSFSDNWGNAALSYELIIRYSSGKSIFRKLFNFSFARYDITDIFFLIKGYIFRSKIKTSTIHNTSYVILQVTFLIFLNFILLFILQ